jgi:hypothetical protein
MFPVFSADGNKIRTIAAVIPGLQTGRWYTIFIFEFFHLKQTYFVTNPFSIVGFAEFGFLFMAILYTELF